jgi:hypothetical protein
VKISKDIPSISIPDRPFFGEKLNPDSPRNPRPQNGAASEIAALSESGNYHNFASENITKKIARCIMSSLSAAGNQFLAQNPSHRT